MPATQLRNIPLVDRIKTAVEWAIKWYLAFNLALLAFLAACFFGLRVKTLVQGVASKA